MIASVIRWSLQNRFLVLLVTCIAVASGVYSVRNTPLDAIPDFIPIVGLLDDAAVIAFVLRAVQTDIQNFKDWEDGEDAGNSPDLAEEDA